MPSDSPGVFAARATCACVLAALLSPSLARAGMSPLTLDEAVRRASAGAPLLEARRAEVSAARQEAVRAGALPDPMLTVGIDNLPVTGADAFDPAADFMTMKKIGLRQEIPARAKREAARTLAARTVDEAAAGVQAGQLEVRRAAAEAWIDLWTAQRELDALQALRAEAGLAAALARARVAGGGGAVGDALAAAAAVLELDNRIEAARATRVGAHAALARWLGDDAVEPAVGEPAVVGPAVIGPVADAPDFGALPVSETRLLAAVDRTGGLLRSNAQLETAAAAVTAARAEKRPDWSVGASYGQRDGGRSDMVMLEVGVGLPLFARNRQDRGVAAREADYQAALALREDLRRQERARIRAGIARWQGALRQVRLHADALLPLARDRSATALAGYRAGGALQPWLDARRDELAARLSHVEHLGALGRAWAALAYLLPMEAQP